MVTKVLSSREINAYNKKKFFLKKIWFASIYKKQLKKFHDPFLGRVALNVLKSAAFFIFRYVGYDRK